MEVQDRLVWVADLEILVDHPCDLPLREHAFFFLCRSASSWMQTLLLKSPFHDRLETTPYLEIKNLEVRLQRCPCDNRKYLQIGNSLRGFNLAHPSLLQWDHLHTRTSILKSIRQIPNFLKSGQAFELKSFSIFFLGKLCLSSLVLAPPHEH